MGKEKTRIPLILLSNLLQGSGLSEIGILHFFVAHKSNPTKDNSMIIKRNVAIILIKKKFKPKLLQPV